MRDAISILFRYVIFKFVVMITAMGVYISIVFMCVCRKTILMINQDLFIIG